MMLLPDRIAFVKLFFEPSTTFSKPRAVAITTSAFFGPIVLNVVPPPISEAPHETGVSGVDVSKDTDRRDSVRNFQRVHLRPVPATLQFTRDLTGS